MITVRGTAVTEIDPAAVGAPDEALEKRVHRDRTRRGRGPVGAPVDPADIAAPCKSLRCVYRRCGVCGQRCQHGAPRHHSEWKRPSVFHGVPSCLLEELMNPPPVPVQPIAMGACSEIVGPLARQKLAVPSMYIP